MIENCTIINNHAAQSGGGIYCGGTNVVVLNTILWGNTGSNDTPDQIQGSPQVSYCCVLGGWTNNGTGNISACPLLVHGYKLSYASPCIDAGLSDDVASDWKRAARWDDPDHNNIASIWDIGADEFTSDQYSSLVIIFGTISYSGGQTGAFYIGAATISNDWQSVCSWTTNSATGSFTLLVPSNATYWIVAFCDANDNGTYDATEPVGSYSSNPVTVTCEHNTWECCSNHQSA